jgi:hypothetical protein
MWQRRDANPAVTRFRRIVTLSMLIRIAVLLVALLLLARYLGGI